MAKEKKKSVLTMLREHDYDCDICGSRIEMNSWCYRVETGESICLDCYEREQEVAENDQKRGI